MRRDEYTYGQNTGNKISSHVVTQSGNTGYDLLKIPFIKKLFLWRGFPYASQILMLGVFIALIVIG